MVIFHCYVSSPEGNGKIIITGTFFELPYVGCFGRVFVNVVFTPCQTYCHPNHTSTSRVASWPSPNGRESWHWVCDKRIPLVSRITEWISKQVARKTYVKLLKLFTLDKAYYQAFHLTSESQRKRKKHMSFSIFFHLSLSKNRALPNPLACHHLSHSKKAMLTFPHAFCLTLLPGGKKKHKMAGTTNGSLLDHNPGKWYDMNGILKQKYIKIIKYIWLQQTQGENDGWACMTRATQFDTFAVLRPIGGETTALDHLMLGIPFHKSNGHQWTLTMWNWNIDVILYSVISCCILYYHLSLAMWTFHRLHGHVCGERNNKPSPIY